MAGISQAEKLNSLNFSIYQVFYGFMVDIWMSFASGKQMQRHKDTEKNVIQEIADKYEFRFIFQVRYF